MWWASTAWNAGNVLAIVGFAGLVLVSYIVF
jgi:hypothetical protein